MDKASVFGAEDCRFESCHDQIISFFLFFKKHFFRKWLLPDVSSDRKALLRRFELPLSNVLSKATCSTWLRSAESSTLLIRESNHRVRSCLSIECLTPWPRSMAIRSRIARRSIRSWHSSLSWAKFSLKLLLMPAKLRKFLMKDEKPFFDKSKFGHSWKPR